MLIACLRPQQNPQLEACKKALYSSKTTRSVDVTRHERNSRMRDNDCNTKQTFTSCMMMAAHRQTIVK
jgi:hypothetical protein